MNPSVVLQNAFASCEVMKSTVSDSGRTNSVVCPKPRRPGVLGRGITDPVRPLRRHFSHQVELCDSKEGSGLLDIILAKGGCGLNQMPSPVASSPPYFYGSPPSRAANPLVHDTRFGKVKLQSVSPLSIPLGLPLSPSPASPRKGCAHTKFGHTPAAVRIEGFNCLDRDRQNRSVSAVA